MRMFAGDAKEKIANEVGSAYVVEPGDGTVQDTARSVQADGRANSGEVSALEEADVRYEGIKQVSDSDLQWHYFKYCAPFIFNLNSKYFL